MSRHDPRPLIPGSQHNYGRPAFHLGHYIEQMIATSREPYPPERTLLPIGALAVSVDATGHCVHTPHVAIPCGAGSHSLVARRPVAALEAES